MKYSKETLIHAAPERVFAFHERPDAINMLIPPFENAKVIQTADISVIGSRAIVETKLFGLIPTRWIAEHTAYDPPRSFEDVQISGPFKSWRHRHSVEPHPDGSILRDEIDFEPPGYFIGVLAAPYLVLPRIEKMFEYRHEVTKKWCEGT